MPEDSASPSDEAKKETQSKPPKLKPALEQLGTALCPICKRRVAVYLAKTQRPFINCGYCAVNSHLPVETSCHAVRKAPRTLPATNDSTFRPPILSL